MRKKIFKLYQEVKESCVFEVMLPSLMEHDRESSVSFARCFISQEGQESCNRRKRRNQIPALCIIIKQLGGLVRVPPGEEL
jgi:hypothetical protein